jgi:hypothetical protein
MKKLIRYSLVLIFSIFLLSPPILSQSQSSITQFQQHPVLSDQIDLILSSEKNPFYSILGTSLACQYNDTTQFLKPMLLVENNTLSQKQIEFISAYQSVKKILSIGFSPTTHKSTTILGSPPSISQKIAKTYFKQSDETLILPYNQTITAYTQSLMASPLSSYLHIPILLYNTTQQNHQEIIETLNQLNTKKIYLVGDINPSLFQNNYNCILLKNKSIIQDYLLSIIKNKFHSLDYITLTNPADTLPLSTLNSQLKKTKQSNHHTALYFLGKKHLLTGTDTITKQISIPKGIHKLSINISLKNTTSIFPSKTTIPIFLSAELTDSNGRTIAYGHSPGYQKDSTYIETLITNKSGEYKLTISLFHGYRGGFFSLRGLSNIDTTVHIKQNLQTLSSAHYPLIPNLSQNAGYLTSAHGGIIIANEHFSLTDSTYETIANHHATGPWYDETLHAYNNEKVAFITKQLNTQLNQLKTHDLYESYVNGSGWLALLGDTNMIPMYYYKSNQTHLAERGLPSDNPYSLHHQLSPGRIMSYTAADASVLIVRTLFYKHLCGPAQPEDEWHRKFNFIYGEGFGETGGIFHQIPYADEIESYGFVTNVYGDLKNSRQVAERLGQYTDANFIEYLGHGDWYWYIPSIYGFNTVGQSIGSVNVRDWNITRPNVMLTSACLMGRVDGVPPKMSIALSFLHAGSNAFVGATRETGQEAGLTVMENHLILDDFSLGEALRGEKQVDKIGPTYYVRCLFGDPAFNPYDPIHGFSNQGRPLN